MEEIREAFQKVKQDMDSLRNDLDLLKFGTDEINESINEIRAYLRGMNEEMKKISYKQLLITQTQEDRNKTDKTYNTTDKQLFKALKTQYLPISTGNEGVPTDRQTDRQTDQQTDNTLKKALQELQETFLPPHKEEEKGDKEAKKDPIEDAAKALDSLDNLKKEIRLKFKRLTDKEWLVFSTMYQLDEEKGFSDYKTISDRLNLTESSIRDYIGRLIKKGVPVEKNKINNKNIQLKISENLKKVASLPTIIKLRGI
ncbi:MAG: helix-turn-helix domain-containing protein [Nanoarchaeota archaeon]|nr:helix-turn-helix domain-containing protein [Nanoarchaeota archaeon]